MFDLSSTVSKVVFGLLLALIGLFLFFPLYWLVISSVKSNAELYSIIPTPFPLAPTLTHFITALTTGKLPMYLVNSLIASGSSAALNTLLALYAGYSFAKYRFTGRQPVMLFMLSAQMFPFGLLLISIYPLMSEVGLLDTRLGLILSYIVFALPVSTYMLYSYFSQVPGRTDRGGAGGRGERSAHLPHHRHPDLDSAHRHGVPVFLHVVVERSSLLDDAHRLRRQAHHRAGPAAHLSERGQLGLGWRHGRFALSICPHRCRFPLPPAIFHSRRYGRSC